MTRSLRDVLPGRVGLALGSGAARGWAHIGVIRALLELGIAPEVVCGSSVGAVVGAAYASNQLDAFERWVRGLDRSLVLRNLDLSFRGGLLKGTQFFSFMSPELPDCDIAALPRAFGAVATDLQTGQEVWLREGSLHDALRASVALPGLITPAEHEGRWLVDGGLVNPVPVSLCRAMGADSVVAVDLNTTLLSRRRLPRPQPVVEPAEPDQDSRDAPDPASREAPDDAETDAGSLFAAVEQWAQELRERIGASTDTTAAEQPSLYEVLGNSLNIMQVRITRSRMAGDPPDLLVAPRLAELALFDLERGAEAIAEGHRATQQALSGARAASLGS